MDTQRGMKELNVSLEKRITEEIARSRSKDLRVMQHEKLASIGQLAAGVAHEINTPLSFVSGNIQAFKWYFGTISTYLAALEEFIARTATAEQRQELIALSGELNIDYIMNDCPELIAEAQNGVERVSRIVSDLKRFSRIDTAIYEEIDLIECLDSCLSVLTHELKRVTLEREGQRLPLVYCNPSEMNQVLLNLLLNAAQAVPPAGMILVKSWYDDTFVAVSITDNGDGIPPENISRIFEPFFTTKKVGDGAGLGLSVCRSIITEHKGELLVESAVGVGSTFTVMLPRNVCAPKKHVVAAGSSGEEHA